VKDAMDEGRLIELAAMAATDTRRVEAAKDPLVRAWLLEHDAFVEDAPIAPEEGGAVNRAAEAALARARAEATRGPAVVLELPRAAHARRGLPRWALAAAALVVVAGAAVIVPRFAAQDSPSFRSLAPGSLAPRLVTLPAVLNADGKVVLRWTPLAGAETHRVEILKGLGAVATYDVATGDSLVLDPLALPAGDLLWRVLALRDGAAIDTSQPRALPR